jgi:hypothetical protein
MSHSFDCVVDTNELAHSVNSVKKHVDTTTGAVVAMKVAVIKAEKEGADHVCRKVNQGFYSMIHSQISQKMATLQSRVDAQLMRLNQQRKQLTGIRRRMERDYQMISARYAKLFNALNRNLRQRVTELDRPIMDLATTDADQVTNRSNLMVSAVPLGQAESVKTSQRLATSNLKRRAAEAITTIERFIAGSNRLQAVTDSILLRRRTEAPDSMLNIPVAVVESNYDNSGNLQTQTYISSIGVSDQARAAIENRFSQEARQGSLPWSVDPTINPEVANQFRQLVAASGLDPRRQQTILQMFEAHPFQTF